MVFLQCMDGPRHSQSSLIPRPLPQLFKIFIHSVKKGCRVEPGNKAIPSPLAIVHLAQSHSKSTCYDLVLSHLSHSRSQSTCCGLTYR